VEGSDLGVIWVIIQNLSGGPVRNCGQPDMAQRHKLDFCVVLNSREALRLSLS
jgi:hypothetical protein